MKNHTDKDHRTIGTPTKRTGSLREVLWEPSSANRITPHWASAHNRLSCCSQDTHISWWLENNITCFVIYKHLQTKLLAGHKALLTRQFLRADDHWEVIELCLESH